MPVTSLHPEYARSASKWHKVLDCYEGEEAIKDAGERYLPRLPDQDKKDFEAYKMRANFFPALQRTVDGLVGGVFRIDPKFKGLDPEWEKDITLTGLNAIQFCKHVTTRVSLTARGGVLVDWDESGRPFATFYDATDIVNWGDGWVLLRESEPVPDPSDRFKVQVVTIYRELRIVEGMLTVTLHKPNGKGWTEFVQDPPVRAGGPVDFMPFVLIQPTGDHGAFQNPPLLGMANVNLAAYRTSADLEAGRHLCGFPTPWIADDGVKQEIKNNPATKLKLGSGGAFVLATGGTAGFMEFQGQGLQSLTEGLAERKEEMGALGAQMILTQRTQVETAETARIHASGQTSILANIVTGVEQGLKAVFDLFNQWANRQGETSVEMNRDFVETTMDPQEVQALFNLWNGGAISHETLLWNLKRGQMLQPDQDIEAEILAVDAESEKLRAQGVKDMVAQQKAMGALGQNKPPLTAGKPGANVAADTAKGGKP